MSIERLPLEIDPPPGLEDRTVASQQAERLLASPRRRWRQLAAAVVIFAAGAASGAFWSTDRPVAPGQPRFLLLLHGGTDVSPAEEAEAALAYRDWAIGLRAEGRFVSGERLAAAAAVVPEGRRPEEAAQGFFVVSAADLEEAMQLAQSAPHVARGGTIVVRPIDTP